jgi:hypothetical protein
MAATLLLEMQALTHDDRHAEASLPDARYNNPVLALSLASSRC